jgi:predicted lipoprotein
MRTQRLSLLGGTIAKPAGPLLPNSRFALPFVLAGVEGSRDLLGDDGFTAADATATDKENDAVAMLGSVATDLGFALRAGQAAEALAPDPFTDPQARERLTPMVLSLKNAESVGSSALGGLTGLSLGFNSLDGD